MTRSPPELVLVTPVLGEVEAFRPALEAAAAGGGVAALLLRLAAADERTLVNRVKALAPAAQAHGIAVTLADPGGGVDAASLVVRGGADGVHADGAERLRELRDRLGPNRTLGAGGLRSKHDAMVAGEIGVDYVMFGEPGPDGSAVPFGDVLDRSAWWAEIFEVPCIAHVRSLADLPAAAGTGAEFVALGDAVWSHPDGPGAALAEARRLVGSISEPAA